MLKTRKVATSELDIGMYVSGLDRPWLETPFFTEGFPDREQEDIARLQKYCQAVYIDTRRSLKPDFTLQRESPTREVLKPQVTGSAE
ncbi:MAG: DUF3391 domain-containing protein [Halioglobus sp.]